MAIERDKRTGRYRFRSWVKYPDGTRERVFGTPGTPGPYQDLPGTKAGAIAADIRAKAAALQGKRATPTSNQLKGGVPILNDYSTIFLANYLPGQKPRELSSKRQILKGHLLPAFGTMRLDEIRQTDVDAFAAAELRRCARKTVNNRLAVLSTLLRYAHENELIPEPKLRCFVTGGVQQEDAPIHAVPPADVERLVAAAPDERLRTAVLLASEAGLRVGEILGLQFGDLREGEIRVNRAVDSEGNVGLPKHDKRRSVPISPALAVALSQQRERQRGRGLWVIGRIRGGGMLRYHALLEQLKKLYVAAGVEVPVSEAGVTMPWHSLRHTFGTECAGRGVPVVTLKELMGHKKIETTLRYIAINNQQKHDAIALAFGRATVVPPGTFASN